MKSNKKIRKITLAKELKRLEQEKKIRFSNVGEHETMEIYFPEGTAQITIRKNDTAIMESQFIPTQ